MLSFLMTVGLLGATDAKAYTTWTAGGNDVRWASTSISFLRDPNLSSDEDAAVDEALSRWYDTPTWVYITAPDDDSDGWALANGESEVVWTNSSLVGGPAVCYTYWDSSGEIYEADVLMGDHPPWDYSHDRTEQYAYGGSSRPAVHDLIHEFGHGIGLGHEDGVYNIMGSAVDHTYTNGSQTYGYVGEDTATGAAYLYGSYSYYEDIGVVHWKRVGSAGGYSDHGRTTIYDSSGTELHDYQIGGEPFFLMPKGAVYEVEALIENNGASVQSVDVSYYLSSDTEITTADTLIDSYSGITFSPDTPFLSRYQVSVPSTASSGVYWLGIIVDPDDDIAEGNEDNNATYLAAVWVY